MLNLIGYWTDTKFNRIKTIHPKYLVDANWEADRRSDIVKYLRSGIRVMSDLGFSYCRFEDGPPDHEMGCCELSDGVYAWPEGLAIYVERYNVRLPDEFIQHMAESNFTIPGNLDVRNDEPMDLNFWVRWCKKQRRKLFIKSVRDTLRIK